MKQWLLFFSINMQVVQVFGVKVGVVYGIIIFLQVLYDNRDDGYSQLLSYGIVVLMNVYVMFNYVICYDVVIEQFLGVLLFWMVVGVQVQKFLNVNYVYGFNECLN